MMPSVQPHQRSATILCIALALALSTIFPNAARADLHKAYVKRSGSRLSVAFADVPLDRVIPMLEREAKIVVRAPASVGGRKVNVSFEDLDIERGMRRLLRSVSLTDQAVLYAPGRDGRVVFLVLDKKLAGSADGVAAFDWGVAGGGVSEVPQPSDSGPVPFAPGSLPPAE